MITKQSPFFNILRNDLPVKPSHFSILGPVSHLTMNDILHLYPEAEIIKGNPRAPMGATSYVMFDMNKVTEKDIANAAKNSNSIILVGTKNHKRRELFSTQADRRLYDKYSLYTVYREPVGGVFDGTDDRSFLPHLLNKLLPVSNLYSPYIVSILTPAHSDKFAKYRSRTSISARTLRIYSRTINKLRNHRVHDYYCNFIALTRLIPGIADWAYRRYAIPYLLPAIKKHKKYRIVFITGQLAVGGVEKVLLSVVASLPKDKFEIILYTTAHNANPWSARFSQYGAVRHIPALLGHKWPVSALQRFLEDSIIIDNPDLILVTNSTLGYKALPKIKGSIETRVVDLLHTYGTPREKDAFLRISAPYRRLLDLRIVISEFLKEYLMKKYSEPDKRVRVIHNGLTEDDKREIAGVLKSNLSKKNAISYIGRLQEDKSPERLIWIAYELKDYLQRTNQKVVIFGEGALKSSLEKLATSLEIINTVVVFRGHTDTPIKDMAESRFTILVSNLEGIPMSTLESMAVGTPVISTGVGGIPEIITDGIDGYTVAIDDKSETELIKELSQTAKAALGMNENAYAQLSSNAQRKINHKFMDMGKEYAELLESLA